MMPGPAAQTSAGVEVHVVVFKHCQGLDIEVHPTEESAVASAAEFARRWWSQEVGEDEMPAGDDAVVKEYFERVDGESCIIRPVRVQGASSREWVWVCEAHPTLPFPHDDCGGPGMLARCEWFAGCGREANAGTLLHPILGFVPVCARCRELVGALT